MPRVSAASLIALLIISCLRPCGRSGWVTSARIRCPVSARCSRSGKAKSPVPSTMIRIGSAEAMPGSLSDFRNRRSGRPRSVSASGAARSGQFGSAEGSVRGGRESLRYGSDVKLLDDLVVPCVFSVLLGLTKLLLELSQLVFHGMQGQRVEIVDEELAVEVVRLMLDGSAEQIFDLVLHEFAFHVVCLHLDFPCAPNLRIQPREAQATFVVLDRRMPFDDHGIDEYQFLVLLYRLS